ncbi:hypothetical protein U9M48_031888 [Paspalum notatum var. saurae]|uniref:Uncharacterized protein n=1 Tax=Paspalum notatum var. saurae TaxID=547442 RepID=A0AAQ3U3W5_PASNO
MLKSTMKEINKASMSKASHDKYLDVIGELMELLEHVEPDIGVDESCETSDVEGDLDEGVLVGDLREDILRKRRHASSSDAGRDNQVDLDVEDGGAGVGAEPVPDENSNGGVGHQPSAQHNHALRLDGACLPDVEAQKLGAKREKKNRKYKKCGIVDGHNSRTCLSVKENSDRLAKLGGRTRGRPPSSKNKSARTTPEWNETSTSKKRRLIVSDDDESADDSI